MDSKTKTIQDGMDSAAKWIRGFFSAKNEPTEADLKKARVASAYLATGVRAYQAETQRDKFRFSVASAITEDKEELAKYLKVSRPKKLGGK